MDSNAPNEDDVPYEVLGTKILVRRFKKATKTKMNILLPENHQKAPSRGRVLKVGDGKLLDNGVVVPLKVKKGQIVAFNEYSGSLLEAEDPVKGKESELIVLNDEDEILAIIKEK